MHIRISLFVIAQVLALIPAGVARGQSAPSAFALKSLDELEVLNGKAEMVSHHGRSAVHVIPAGPPDSDEVVLAILKQSDFEDGAIEAEVAGAPRQGAPGDARGFIGIAFRVQGHGSKFENIYLRPTNGRADDQLRRNHSVQYESIPDYPWHRLRKESPGGYESYVDLEADTWTRLKIVVSGMTARLFVNGAAQPCLIVNDLKLRKSRGQIALWANPSTDAYFSSVSVRSDVQGPK